ncbi:MAG: pilus assembly protein PilY [Alteromonadaceae bacterium]|nr:pilus assembly protein PilY [Alteromonadaceae bacterium]
MKTFSPAWLLTLSLCGIAHNATGDDLDIFIGTADSATTYNPNVLFIMDTSGSMGGMDGGDESRMFRVQNALKSALGTATNINAGLMRFSDYGGPILYPTTNINRGINAQLSTSTGATANDGYEINGAVNTGSDEVVISYSTSEVTSAFRFTDLNIPLGATITSAYIKFTSAQYDISSTNISIAGELVNASSPLTTGFNDLSGKTLTTAEVDWSTENEFPADGEDISTPDLSPVIQELVNQAGWCGGNALTILLNSQGNTTGSTRRVMAHDDGTGTAPQLIVNYDQSSATGCVAGDAQYQVADSDDNVEEATNGWASTGKELTFRSNSNNFIGLRFPEVNIPQGATVSRAYIEFTAYDTDRNNGASMLIRGIDKDDIPNFRNHNRFDLQNIAKTAGITWSMPEFKRNQSYDTVDISGIVNAIVGRAGWQAGNSLGFVLSDFNALHGAYSYSGKPSKAPRLYVEFSGNAEPGASLSVRDLLISQVDDLSANGLTPIVDTLYEAARYYGGRSVDYGLSRGNSSVSSSVRRSTRVSHRDSYTGADSVLPYGCSAENLSDSDCITEYIPSGAEYISPVQDLQCQTNNHIVLLSDGEANNNHSASKIQAMLGTACKSANSGELCGLDLVSNISKASTSVIGAKVTTHTIGFAANNYANNFLYQLALQSGGGFYTADNSEDLLAAFQTILRAVKDVNATFVSPGVAVNQLNRLTHQDELYYALFKPAEGTLWPGNLKKYRIDGDKVFDRNGLAAIDDNTGFFADSSHSYWSLFQDGADVRAGGAASLLPPSRNVYFFDGPGSIVSSANQLHENNSAITTATMGTDGDADPQGLRENLLKWARGVDLRDYDGDGDITETRLQMGDPIHSQPVIVNYGNNDSVIFIATNHGFLHAFDAATGSEYYSVAPKSLLVNVKDFYQDNSSYKHIYGLDGHMVLREFDGKKYLYVGMRRGGRNYYVFDITSKTSPSLVYAIEGGTAGLEKLGQSWSRPILTKMKLGGTAYNVMVIGGGYDETQDTNNVRTTDVVGNAVMIFNADTGALLWKASNSGADVNIAEMQYAIPGHIAAIDRDNDGFADHLYATDMGGQVFRFDVYNGESGADFIKGQRIADLAGSGSSDNRHFYYGVDVSEVAQGGQNFYAVVIGSGWRANPLDTVVNDRFYMLKDEGVFTLDDNGKFSFPTTITENNLFDATTHSLTASNEATRSVAISDYESKQGWYITMQTAGEKILSSPVIVNYKVFFTSYVPAASSTSDCAPPAGNSRAYLVNLIDGNAAGDLNQDGDYTASDRYAQLTQTGIAPDTKILIEDAVNPTICLGTECVSAVVAVDEDGNEEACTSDFECLSQNIFGRYQRVMRGGWSSDVEQ